MIGQFVMALVACLFLLAWLHSMDVAQDNGKPSRKQLRTWRRDRLHLDKTWNRRIR